MLVVSSVTREAGLDVASFGLTVVSIFGVNSVEAREIMMLTPKFSHFISLDCFLSCGKM